jgi:phage terminase large subunit
MSKAATPKKAAVKQTATKPRTAANVVAAKRPGPPAGAKKLQFKPSWKQHLAWLALQDTDTEELVYGGAAGGGKSWLGATWKIHRRLRYPGSRGLTGRTVFNDLKESTLITYFEVLSSWGLVAGTDYFYHGTDHYIQFKNGSREVFKALGYQPSDPDYQRLGSTEFTDLWIEEAGDGLPKKAMQIAKSRIRWKLDEFDLIPKVLITCNPGYHWIRTEYFYDDEDNPIELKAHQKVVRALVTDNPKAEFVKRYKKNLEGLSDYDRSRLLEGDWNAVEKTGGEFYHAFDTEKHSGDYSGRYNSELALHITLDFNTAPYMTLNVWQIFEDEAGSYEAVQVDEFTPESPNNNTPAVVRLFVEKYGDHEAEVFVYGDPAGKHEDTRSEKGHNDFTLVLNGLESMHQVTKRVGLSAPSVSMRGLWQNSIFKGEQPGLKILISKNCRNTLQDYQKVKKGADGAKEKRRVKNPTTGVSYEQYGHCSDANDYFLCKAFATHYKAFKNRKRKPGSGPAGEGALNPNFSAEVVKPAKPAAPPRAPRTSKSTY